MSAQLAPAVRPAAVAGAAAARPDAPITLADVVRDPSLLDDADHAQVAALLTQVAAIQTRLAARLAELAQHARRPDEPPISADDAAARLGVTKGWLRHHSDTLPFTVRISAGNVRYDPQGIRRWLARRTGPRR